MRLRLDPDDWLWSVPRCWDRETVVIMGGGESLTDDQIKYVRWRHAAGACRVVAINRAYQRAPWADWLYACDPGWFWEWCSGPGKLDTEWPDALEFAGTKISVWSYAKSYLPRHGENVVRLLAAGVKLLQHPGEGYHTGMSRGPGWVCGNNACYQLLSGPVPYTGAVCTILLGIDMSGYHWHEPWPTGDLKFEEESETNTHRAAIDLGGRDVELGWYDYEPRARQVERHVLEHIQAGCPQPAHHLSGSIPMFATLLEPLWRINHEVVNCSPGSALKMFGQAKLEDVL